MIKLNGKYNTAEVFTNIIEDTAISQIIDLLNLECFKDSQIRIMPDVHAGAGCTIGTTMTIKDRVVPNLVGVDISCGMLLYKLDKNASIDLEKLDKLIHEKIPSGFNIRESRHKLSKSIKFRDVKAKFDLDRAQFSIGTLGGGNHFIEVDRDNEGYYYIVVHSGSRHFGLEVAKYWQSIAIADRKSDKNVKIDEIIAKLKAEGRQSEIPDFIKANKPTPIPEALMWLEGDHFQDYMNDMIICQSYAQSSRLAMMTEIIEGMNLDKYVTQAFETLHNYIDFHNTSITKDYVLRKGAIALYENELALIPMNMRDGSLIVKGKGNSDWNWSGPHGAGRLMSRAQAKKSIELTDFQDSMKGIYTTCVNTGTIDESPMAYKPMESIINNIGESCEIINTIKPIYNFKAAE